MRDEGQGLVFFFAFAAFMLENFLLIEMKGGALGLLGFLRQAKKVSSAQLEISSAGTFAQFNKCSQRPPLLCPSSGGDIPADGRQWREASGDGSSM